MIPRWWPPARRLWWAEQCLSGGMYVPRLDRGPVPIPISRKRCPSWRFWQCLKKVSFRAFFHNQKSFSFSCPKNWMVKVFLKFLWVTAYGLRIPELVAQKYAPSHAEPLNLLKEKIDDEMTIAAALKSYNGVSNTTSSESGTANAMAPARTAASPDWGNEPPLNFRKRIQVNSISISDFDSGHTYLSSKRDMFVAVWCGSTNMFQK